MGKAVFRSSKDLETEGPNRNKRKIKTIKSAKNTKLNLILLIQILNLTLTAYLYYSLVGAFWK